MEQEKRRPELREALPLMRRFYREYVQAEKIQFLVVCGLHILFATALIIPPFLIKTLIDEAIGNENPGMVTVLAAGITGTFFFVAMVGKMRSYWGHINAQKITYTLRNNLYEHLQKQSFSFYDNTKTGELISRVIDDLNVVQEVLYHGPENLVTNGLMVVLTGIMVFALTWKLALICSAIMLLIAVANYVISVRMYRGARQVREDKASLASRAEDNISGMRIIQSFVRERFEMDRFEQNNRDHYRSRLEVIRPMTWIFPISILILGIALGLAAGFGGYWTIRGAMTVGTLTAFIMYMHRFMWPLLALSMISEPVTRFLAGVERYFSYMDMTPDIQDSESAVALENVRGEVEFRHVSFRYEKEPILDDVNLHVRPGETIALVGPSGAGKTTITRLLPRFYEPQNGEILLDGVPIKDLRLDTLRANIGIVMQDDFLFSDTLLNNIRYGRLEATREEVIDAAEKGNVDPFAHVLEDGYETEIGQRGTKLSEGQAQRVSIARAILKDAPIFILDEATSSVDSETEILIQEALERLMEHRTCFVIAHRLSTIRNADRILFVDRGQVVEEGTHDELLARDGKYAHFYNLQFRIDARVV